MGNEYSYVTKYATYDGKKYKAYGKTDIEAQLKLREILRKAKSGEDRLDNKITVKKWAALWLDTYVKPRVREPGQQKIKGTMTKKSYALYPQKIDGYIIPAIGNTKLKDVKDTHLQMILNKQSGKSKSSTTKLRNVIQEMFSQAAASRIIPYDPSLRLTLPVTTEGKRRSLTAYERQILLTVAQRHRCGLWVRFLLRTGLRPGETPPLLWCDLDLDSSTPRVHVTKDIESGTSIVGSPKTAQGNRYVPIPDDILPDLKKAKGDHAPFDFVFTQLDGKSMLTKDCVSNNWRSFAREMDLAMGAEHTAHWHIYDPKDVKKDGTPLYPDENGNPKNGHKIAPDLVMYCLRHTYCTDLKAAGVPVDVAKDIMGHADITTTANIYADVDMGSVIRAADLLNRSIGDKAGDKLIQKNA